MTTSVEFMIIAGADNRPPMLEKSMYDSWKSRMEIYIENRKNVRMILDSVQNGPLEGRKGLLNVIIVKTGDLDAYDSDYDDVSTTQTVLMINLSYYGSYVISE
nr:ribonuclease H-like domain-containing protein [Tanacetum cinerariifolium]